MTTISPCATCPRKDAGFCGAVRGSPAPAGSAGKPDWQQYLVISPGRHLVLANQASPDVYVLCTGWGFRYVQLPNGRRQILGFLLPGDVLTTSLFRESLHFSVKALTAIQVSTMKRAEIHARAALNLQILWEAAECCAAETLASDNMIAVLGQFSAEERIAYLFLHLMKQISIRSVIRDARYPLPLRQQHIADAVGLTPGM